MREPAAPPVRTAIPVEGIVQGVGFRPFVYALATGQILAVKGLGGYHLAVDAACEPAAAALRARKHREDKPFAVLAAGLAQAR